MAPSSTPRRGPLRRFRSLATVSLVAALGLGSGGCATAMITAATWPWPMPYKGAAVDASLVWESVVSEEGGLGVMVVLPVLDFPFSLAADTLLLPVNLVQWLFLYEPEEKDAPEPEGEASEAEQPEAVEDPEVEPPDAAPSPQAGASSPS